MRYLLATAISILGFLLGVNLAMAKTLRVGVIDTGMSQGIPDGLCKDGHKDFTGTGPYDYNGHGTNISGLIHKYAKGKDYCQVHYKYWIPGLTNDQSSNYFMMSLKAAISQKVDILNISGGGFLYSKEEHALTKTLLDKGVVVIVAAGNERKYLEKVEETTGYFPAQYDPRLIVVGSGINGKVHWFSNYGPIVDVYENGLNAKGLFGKSMSGTSQATAIHTGKVIQRWAK